jgi:hypothetical protein
MTKQKGLVFLNGKVYEEEFPIDTYISVLAWTQDFWRAFLIRPIIFRWLARIAMGKYAYRELYGAKEAIEKCGFTIWDSYGLEFQEYHKDKVPT